jgi:SAM-dependent methyltransferase
MKYGIVKEKNLKFFGSLFEKFEDEHHVVAQSKISHLKRFEKILELADFSGKSILDVGCGIGGFYGFLRKRGIKADYYGYDINKKMIAFAKSQYPEIQAHFSVLDILESEPDICFDYVIAVGPLNLKIGTSLNLAATRLMLRKMFGFARIGMAFSMTSSLSIKQTEDTYYYNAGRIIDSVSRFCANFKLDHTYLPHDFTVFCYKKSLYNSKLK